MVTFRFGSIEHDMPIGCDVPRVGDVVGRTCHDDGFSQYGERLWIVTKVERKLFVDANNGTVEYKVLVTLSY